MFIAVLFVSVLMLSLLQSNPQKSTFGFITACKISETLDRLPVTFNHTLNIVLCGWSVKNRSLCAEWLSGGRVDAADALV